MKRHTHLILSALFCAFIFAACTKKSGKPASTATPDAGSPPITTDTNSTAGQDPAEPTHSVVPALARIPKCQRPTLVWSAPNQPNPETQAPAIFYSPHQDDETLAMGASIAEHVRKGRPTYVVLLTDGASPINANKLGMTPGEYVQERMREFINACKALGVHRIYIANRGHGFSDLLDKENLIIGFKKTITYFSVLHPKASHKTVSGNCDPYNRNCDRHPTHQAATDAIRELHASGVIDDVRLFRVYVYYWIHRKKNEQNACAREADWLKPVDTRDKIARLRAFSAYRNDSDKRHGIGYWSVPPLFDHSRNSDLEYVDLIEHDCAE